MIEALLVDSQDADSGCGVTATDHRHPGRLGHGLRHCSRPGRERLHLEHTHRPVPHDRARVGDVSGERLRGSRADIDTRPAIRDLVRGHHPHVRIRSEPIGDNDVHGQDHLDTAPFGLFQIGLDRRELIGFQKRIPHREPMGRQKREGHSAADQETIHAGNQIADDPELVADLGAAKDDHIRPIRLP